MLPTFGLQVVSRRCRFEGLKAYGSGHRGFGLGKTTFNMKCSVDIRASKDWNVEASSHRFGACALNTRRE